MRLSRKNASLDCGKFLRELRAALKFENFAEFSLDRELALARHTAADGKDIFPGELNHEVASASGLLLE